jgi:lipoprotein-releasing system ATP-binding protein
MDDSQVVVSATDLHREFRTADTVVSVLKGLSVRVDRKEMAAVVGASGVGKSTLLHLLGGLDRPSRGEVAIGGISLNDQSETELARLRNRKVGFVFQHHYLLEDFDARENVMIPMLVAGRDHAHARERAELLMVQVGLSDRMTHRPGQLSGGEQQRVAVARALANDPEIVLADEPSGNLDTVTGRKLHDLLFQLNEDKGVTFVIATHNRELAKSCDRQLEIVDGKIGNETKGR